MVNQDPVVEIHIRLSVSQAPKHGFQTEPLMRAHPDFDGFNVYIESYRYHANPLPKMVLKNHNFTRDQNKQNTHHIDRTSN